MALPQLEGFWDSPFVSGIAFAPRATPRTGRCDARVREGVLAVSDNAELGWCLYRSADAADAAPVVIYFHANAETAADVEHLTPLFATAGCAAGALLRAAARARRSASLAARPTALVLAFDYRGYGWSTGRPTLGTLMPDMSRVATALPALLSEHMLADRPLIVYGRSLGAACAVHVTSLAPVRARSQLCFAPAHDDTHLFSPGGLAPPPTAEPND
jgi:pimeloyl-ACP methyl ester carboxylesterase